MSKWLLRGLVFAALMVIVRLLQGAMINAWETKAVLISIVAGRCCSRSRRSSGATSTAAPTRAPTLTRTGAADLAMTWLLAGLFAGVSAALVAWFISLFYDEPLRRGAASTR